MKTYLNIEERKTIVILSVVHEKALEVLKTFVDNLTKEEQKYLKMGCSFIQKALSLILARLGRIEQSRVLRTAEQVHVAVMPKETSDMWKKRITKEIKDDGVFVDLDTLYDLAELTINTSCTPCIKGSEDEIKNCVFKNLFLSLEIPVANDQASDDVCPYCNKN